MNPDASVSQAHLYLSGPDDNNRRRRTHLHTAAAAERGALIGSHQLGITKSTCHPQGFSNPARRGPATGADGPRARCTQTLHPHCQLGVVMPYS